MTKRELHTFLYECDGYLTDGRKCIEDRRIEAFTSLDADIAISKNRPGQDTEWRFTAQGWLCHREHRSR